MFPDDLLREGWDQAKAYPPEPSRTATQTPLDFSASPRDPSCHPPAFQTAERPGEYLVTRPVTVDEVFEFVRQELERRFFRQEALTSPEESKRYLIAELAREEREVFAAIFLDNQHRPTAFEKLFYGTIDGCSVHSREVVKRSLELNAAALILAHNHPSGDPKPSSADQYLTKKLKDALDLVDIRVLDHIIIGGPETVSFAERGML